MKNNKAEFIDLRSDTVTRPTPAMREAMYRAEVGDDVYCEDPTVNRLEQMAADKMGKDAGLFVASGTMGNLTAALAHCQRGDEAVMGHLGHTFLSEGGGISVLGSIFAHVLPNQPDGTIRLDDLQAAVRGSDIHHPITRLVILENTHNRCGGRVLTETYTRQVGELAHMHGLRLHLDGARIFNAAAVQGIDARLLVGPADSVTFCLSKGLCAPVGSVLCGSRDFISRARRIRKQLGGGMRQAGILAAAGIVALEQMVDRLTEDHRRAKLLAQSLSGLPGLRLTYGEPQSNLVFVTLELGRVSTAEELVKRLLPFNVWVGTVNPTTVRMVLHYWIDDLAVERTVQAFTEILAAG